MRCDVSVRKGFRVVAFVLVAGVVLSSVGVAISIFSLMNFLSYTMLFPFSFIVDPPYLGIICAVLLGLFVTIMLVLAKTRKKVCPDIELPFI